MQHGFKKKPPAFDASPQAESGCWDVQLKTYLPANRDSVSRRIDTSIQLAQEVMKLQKTCVSIYHITPSSFVINPGINSVRIVNNMTGDSDPSHHTGDRVKGSGFTRDTLAYYSPERTGRVGLKCDYRSVYYSLGVILYELFSGTPPFLSDAPLELIHAHIAIQPAPLYRKTNGVPFMVSEIVIKLLAKNPNDRYQGICSLIADLERCKESYDRHGTIAAFPPGIDDIPEQLNFPGTIYGRENYISKLTSAFERIRKGGHEFILITGYPGTGKTSLVKTIARRIRKKGGYFISGKFDPIQTEIPHSGITEAFRELIEQIITENNEKVTAWRNKIKKALDGNIHVLAEVIPEIELVVGRDDDGAPQQAHVETGNRFNAVCGHFLQTIADGNSPLVLFLDDIQWADPVSMEFIFSMISHKVPDHLLIICALRSKDHTDSRQIKRLKGLLEKSRSASETIPLGPVSEDSVEAMLKDTLKITSLRSREFARIVYKKTGGNPFFIQRFLQSLYSEKHLYFNYSSCMWEWNKKKIKSWNITRGAADLVAANIRKLPVKTLDILSMAACIGNRFRVDSISEAFQIDVKTVTRHLNASVKEGFVFPAEPAWEVPTKRPASHLPVYEFLHDRIRQSVYSGIPEWTKKTLHLEIGRNAFKKANSQVLNDEVFYIADQINKGVELITDEKELSDLADLNLMAGIRAKKSTAFDSAAVYCRRSANLLSESDWMSDYNRLFQTHMHLAEGEYLRGNTREAETLFRELLINARNRYDKSKIYNSMIILYTGSGQLKEALDTGLKGLRLFGITLPGTIGKGRILLELLKTKAVLWVKPVESLKSLPELTDPEKKEILNLLTNIGTPAYYINPQLFSYSVITGVRLSLNHGITESFPFALIAFGLINGFGFGNYRYGAKLAKAALPFLNSVKHSGFSAKSYFIYGFFIQAWSEHVQKSILYLQRACSNGKAIGDLIYTGHSINALYLTQMIAGVFLDEVFKEFQRNAGFMKRLNDPFISGNYRDNINMYRVLKGEKKMPPVRDEKSYEPEREQEIRMKKNPLALFMFLNIRLKIYYYFGHYKACITIIESIEAVKTISSGTLYLVEYYFYHALSVSAYIKDEGLAGRGGYLKKLKKIRKKMKQWAELCPENFLHKYLLISAEVLSVSGNTDGVYHYYRGAVLSAEENGFTQNAAIAYERWAQHSIEQNNLIGARAYVEEAVNKFQHWGAEGISAFLREKYSGILTGLKTRRETELTNQLDFSSLASSLRAITIEMDLKALLKCVISIAMENAGARRGIFISGDEKKLYIEAEGLAGSCDISTSAPVPLESRDDLLKEAVFYVQRTGSEVVLHDATREGPYVATSYVDACSPKSLLLLPLLRKSVVTGILYLENNGTKGVFTENRVKILKLIAAQSAISLDNARLYENVRLKEQSLRRVSSELLIAEEKERRKIAVGLHDRIGHTLTNARINLSMARNTDDRSKREDKIISVLSMIDQSVRDVQTLTFELSPPVLYDFGLVAAVEWLAERTSREHNFSISVSGDPQMPIKETISVLLFQIIRELVFNIVKHAEASFVNITIRDLNPTIRIDITDDGKGFDAAGTIRDAKKEGGFGLFSIKERLRHFGGDLDIVSAPGNGTALSISIASITSEEENRQCH